MKMDIQAAAGFLNLPIKTLQRWIVQGFLPVHGSDQNPVFEQDWLRAWAKSKNLTVGTVSQEVKECVNKERSLYQAMNRGGVFAQVTGDTVDEVLIKAASLSPVPEDGMEDFIQQLLERERLCSTGQGKGVAIPHVRRPVEDKGLEASITTCFLKEPLDFQAIDGKPVSILFLLISPSVDVHLHLLSRLAFCLRDDSFMDFINQTPLPEILLAKVRELETKVADAGL